MSEETDNREREGAAAPQPKGDDQLKPTPVDPKKDDRGGLATGVDTGAIQPGKTGDAKI
ncbi:hypothetical protein LJR164_004625 [Phenylobacterium sp. LjRoot164]|uniref:hypothetical protein n=1 Tax=unclassified Phenylobacterium TaxID=2640670 RepID=UPI003ECFE254